MVRSRFSTPTIGRESMIGEQGVAVGAVNPEGTVRVRGGLWRARTNRATPIAGGRRGAGRGHRRLAAGGRADGPDEAAEPDNLTPCRHPRSASSV
jgi:hypothetical protein